MRWICETISPKSDKPGPIDLKTGWPTINPDCIYEAPNFKIAEAYFDEKFPNDVAFIYEDDD